MKVHKAKIHSKIRFAREICGRLFSEKKRLTAHVNGMHLKIMKSCSVPGCTFEAAYEASVKYHVRRIHEKITVNCERCDYTCGALGDLNRHISEKHLKLRLKCPFCNFTTFATRKYRIEKHKLEKHKEKVKVELKLEVKTEVP